MASTIGTNHLEAFFERFEMSQQLQSEMPSFVFGKTVYKSCEKLILRYSLLNYSFLEVPLSVIKIDVSLLI